MSYLFLIMKLVIMKHGNVKKQGFFIPNVNTDNFGLKSLRFSAPSLWNKHLKIDNTINSFTKLTSFKKYLINFLLKDMRRKSNLTLFSFFF